MTQRQELAMADHPVSSLTQAIDLAEQWQRSGTHSWFRGQNQVSWPLLSSLARAQTKGDGQRWETQIGRFCDWVRGVPELTFLLEEAHVHPLFAVLQHYGIPTHYLDFTTSPRVAGFFAGAGKPQDIVPGSYGCIFAIDPDEWVDTLRAVTEVRSFPSDAWPEKVTVRVENLWRLETQSGHFVYLPTAGAERVAPPDRIVFPHDGSSLPLTKDDVYPPRKSGLEIRLDEFFTMQLRVDNQIYFRAFFESLSSQNKHRVVYERPESARYLVPGVRPHASWNRADDGWSAYHVESLDAVRTTNLVRLPVRTDAPDETAAELEAVVRESLWTSDGLRMKTAAFRIVPADSAVPPEWVAYVERAVARAWDGVRRLPFTDEQVSATVANTVALASVDASSAPSFGIRDFARLGLDVGLELADAHNTTARAVCRETSYLSAIRPDVAEVIVPELRSRPQRQLLQVLSPRDLFDFDRLVDLFAREIIPSEVLLQRGELAVFYSPSRPTIIGAA
jgi:FRG domain